MTDVAQTFLGESRQYLRGAYLTAIERSVAPLTDAQVWWRPNEASNSIGNLILHLSGNVRQWIVGGVGRQPNERNRQLEFDERKVDTERTTPCPIANGSGRSGRGAGELDGS